MCVCSKELYVIYRQITNKTMVENKCNTNASFLNNLHQLINDKILESQIIQYSLTAIKLKRN